MPARVESSLWFEIYLIRSESASLIYESIRLVVSLGAGTYLKSVGAELDVCDALPPKRFKP